MFPKEGSERALGLVGKKESLKAHSELEKL